MRDQIFVVCAAVNDATRTLPSLVDVDEARELIRWIADAASPLSGEFQQTP